MPESPAHRWVPESAEIAQHVGAARRLLIKQRLIPAPDAWERYLVGPVAVADPALYCTELNRPLSD